MKLLLDEKSLRRQISLSMPPGGRDWDDDDDDFDDDNDDWDDERDFLNSLN